MLIKEKLTLKDIIGQEHLLTKNGLLTKIVEKKFLPSIVFFGPTGIGKTTLAKILASQLNKDLITLDPTKESKADFLKKIKYNLENVVLIDEIHRLNRDKQDILLSLIEDKKIILLGTTTENPYFCLNPALRSRIILIPLKELSIDSLISAIKKKSKILNLNLTEDVIKKIAKLSNGDIRFCLNSLELLISLYDGKAITTDLLDEIYPIASSKISKYDDEFHNLKSALHKSIRGSDPDAAIYYLARLLISNDLVSITRRIIAAAYEDISLANPNLLQRVILACQSAIHMGMPEAKQILATTIIEMCLSPKSNSAYLAINKALNDVKSGHLYSVPNHIKENSYSSASKLGIKGYKYPHDYGGYVNQVYLPKELRNKKYYQANLKSKIETSMNKIHKDFKEQK